MKTYQILETNDILQEGDEYLCSLVPLAWASTTRVGEKSLTMHRRLVSAGAPSEKDHLLSVIKDKNTTIRRLSEKLEAVVAASEKCIQDKNATLERLEQSLSNSQSANIGYAAVVADRHDYIQKLEKDLSFYKEATDAAIADNQFYRRIINKLTQDVQEL